MFSQQPAWHIQGPGFDEQIWAQSFWSSGWWHLYPGLYTGSVLALEPGLRPLQLLGKNWPHLATDPNDEHLFIVLYQLSSNPLVDLGYSFSVFLVSPTPVTGSGWVKAKG